MPTTHATVWTNVTAQIATLLSSHKRLPNPYELAENSTGFLKLGWGLAITPAAENTNRFVCSTKSYRIRYRLAITRQMIATEQDAATRMTADLSLVTDFETILADSHDNNLNAGGGALVKGTGFDGIDTVFIDQRDVYRVLYCTIETEIFKA